MKKLVSAFLGTLVLSLAAGAALAQGSADMTLDRDRLYFRFWTADTDSGEIQMLPNTKHNPLVLPCDLTRFGGQLDAKNKSSAQPVYANVVERLYYEDGQLLVTHGYSGAVTLDHSDTNISQLIASGGTQPAGFLTVDSEGFARHWFWHPSELPANEPIRVELTVEAYSDAMFTQLVGESDPSDNVRNIWIVRQCACN